MGDHEGTQGSSGGQAPPPPPPPYSPPPTGAPQDAQPPTPPPAPPGAPIGQAPAPRKKSRAGLIIAIVVVLLLCCCGGSAAAGWYFYRQGAIEGWTDVEVDTDFGDGVSVDESDPGDAVRVVLEWDDPVDLDLELWEADGETFITSAYTEGSPDVTDGDGAEYFDLDGEYGDGEWVLSVYFASTDGPEETEARVTVRRPGQQDVVVTGTIYYDPDEGDQWHAVRVDADTGDVEVIDRFY